MSRMNELEQALQGRSSRSILLPVDEEHVLLRRRPVGQDVQHDPQRRLRVRGDRDQGGELADLEPDPVEEVGSDNAPDGVPLVAPLSSGPVELPGVSLDGPPESSVPADPSSSGPVVSTASGSSSTGSDSPSNSPSSPHCPSSELIRPASAHSSVSLASAETGMQMISKMPAAVAAAHRFGLTPAPL